MNKFIITIGFLLSFISVKAQIDLNKVVPENPSVASLMKASLTPVTEYAGLPNVEIPIYNVSQGNINVPISLSYHMGGIKVSEESGNVGLGWALNAGGIINRTINGYPDFGEHQNGSKYDGNTEPIPDPVLSTNSINGETYFNLEQNAFIRATDNNGECSFPVNGVPRTYNNIQEASANRPDHLPDTYTFNFNGYSGSFVIGKDRSIYMLEKSNKFIELQFNSELDYSFIIITENGDKHYFDHIALTQIEPNSGISHISTWYLTKTVSTTNEVVEYVYEQNVNTHLNLTKSYPLKTFVQALYVNEGQGGATELIHSAGPQSVIDDVYLTQINFGKGKFLNGQVSLDNSSYGYVKFNYSDQLGGSRLDIPTAFYLDNIKIYDFNSNQIEQHDFKYSYFGDADASSGSIDTGDYAQVISRTSNNPHLNLRLRLDSITSNGKKHEFTYNDSNIIPNKTSMSQDYWGFYNGLQNSRSFVAFGTSSFSSLPNDLKAKRYPVENKAKLFSLKSIRYPTKGYTIFDMESNTYNTLYNSIPQQTSPPPATVPKSDYLLTNGGGQSVSKIIEPKGENVVFKINLAITSTNVNKTCGTCSYKNSCDITPNLDSHPFDFGSDMYVRYTSLSTGGSFTRYFYIEDAIDQFKCNGTVYQSVEFDVGTALNGGYIFEVYFNDFGGLYSGQAKVEVKWDEVKVGISNEGDYGEFALGGGLRIKSINDYDYTNVLLLKRNFNYHYNDTINGTPIERSYGLMKQVPKNHLDSPLYPYNVSQYNDSLNPIPPPPSGNVNLPSLVARTYSHNAYSKDFGSYVGYDQVTITNEDKQGVDNGQSISKFFNYQDFETTNNLYIPSFNSMHKFPSIRLPHNGKMYRQEFKKKNEDGSYTIVSSIDTQYKMNKLVNAENFDYQEMFRTSDYFLTVNYEYFTDLNSPGPCYQATFQFNPLYVTLIEMTSKIQKTYNENGIGQITSEQNYFYESPFHYQITTEESINSDGSIQVVKTRYPDDFISKSILFDNSTILGGEIQNFEALTKLKSINNSSYNTLNRVFEPVQIETFEKINNIEKVLSVQRNNFKIDNSTSFVQLASVETSKGTSALENRVTYLKYNDYGYPIEVSKNNGVHICYIYGYENEYPIARIENATYESGKINSITGSQLILIDDVIAASNVEISNATEHLLREKLDLLRDGFPNAMVTSFTYDPLIGVTSIMDEKGYVMYYEYDELNRLKWVKDDKENLVVDYKYHYIGQNSNN